jgi:hypothetical protein
VLEVAGRIRVGAGADSRATRRTGASNGGRTERERERERERQRLWKCEVVRMEDVVVEVVVVVPSGELTAEGIFGGVEGLSESESSEERVRASENSSEGGG